MPIIKNAQNSKIFESKKREMRSLTVMAQKNQGGFSQPYLGDEKMTKNKFSAQPFPKEVFEFYKEKILAEGPIITRTRLVQVFPFFNHNTLRNWDEENRGIEGKINIGSRKLACYPTQNVVDFIEEMFCKRPLRLAEQEKKRQKEEQERLKQQEKRTINYYKNGETK